MVLNYKQDIFITSLHLKAQETSRKWYKKDSKGPRSGITGEKQCVPDKKSVARL